ncbi:MAG: hypothetical protein ACR2OI_03525 [Acidimicrobiia bacterium]
MLNEENRAQLVVPYSLPPPPRRHLVGASLSALVGAVALIGLFMAEYSATTTVWLTLVAGLGLAGGAGLLLIGLSARRRFREEMEPAAVVPVPVQPLVRPANPAGAATPESESASK